MGVDFGRKLVQPLQLILIRRKKGKNKTRKSISIHKGIRKLFLVLKTMTDYLMLKFKKRKTVKAQMKFLSTQQAHFSVYYKLRVFQWMATNSTTPLFHAKNCYKYTNTFRLCAIETSREPIK